MAVAPVADISNGSPVARSDCKFRAPRFDSGCSLQDSRICQFGEPTFDAIGIFGWPSEAQSWEVQYAGKLEG